MKIFCENKYSEYIITIDVRHNMRNKNKNDIPIILFGRKERKIIIDEIVDEFTTKDIALEIAQYLSSIERKHFYFRLLFRPHGDRDN